MSKHIIKYRSGYKYQLAEDYTVQTSIAPGRSIKAKYIELAAQGMLIVKNGYAWDGPSGPTFDTKSFMRGSLCHDCFYQLVRMGLLEPTWRESADYELKKMCLEDGMNKFRAWYVYKSVVKFAHFAIDPANRIKVQTAP